MAAKKSRSHPRAAAFRPQSPFGVCCAEDIQFAGLICQWGDSENIVGDSWHVLTARINFKFSRAYGKKGPVLTFIEDSPCEVPEQPVATFF